MIGFDKATVNGLRYWNGAIDDVRIWKKALSPEEIQASMNTAPPAGEPGLLAWWNFDETIVGEREVPLFTEPVSSLRAASDGGLWIGTDKGVTLLPVGPETEGCAKFHLRRRTGQGARDRHLRSRGRSDVVRHRWRRRVADEPRGFQSPSSPAHNPRPIPRFTTFTTADGLNNNAIRAIAQDAEGAMWFAGGSVAEAESPACPVTTASPSSISVPPTDWRRTMSLVFISIRKADSGRRRTPASRTTITGRSRSLEKRRAWTPEPSGSIVSTSDGNVWFQVGHDEAKLSRFDGQRLVKLTRDDGLPGARPAALYLDRDGALLVSDWEAGRPVARFDPAATAGERIRFELVEGPDRPRRWRARRRVSFGWAATTGPSSMGQPDESRQGDRRGSARGAGSRWRDVVRHRDRTRSDSIWRYEPSSAQGGTGTWTEFTDANGLPGDREVRRCVRLLTLADGSLLAATMYGARRFDGKQFVPWPADVPRLQTLRIYHATRDAEGGIWLATAEGVFHTDGTAWSKLDMRDGLPEDTINRVHRAADGTVWMGGWNKGLARYRPSKHTPRSPVLTAQTDRDYTDVAALPTINTGQRVTFKFDVVDFYTAIEKRQYRWQLFQGARDEEELAANWQPPGTATQLEQTFAKPGAWTLAVQFIDRDLNYSKPTLATFNVALPWHANRGHHRALPRWEAWACSAGRSSRGCSTCANAARPSACASRLLEAGTRRPRSRGTRPRGNRSEEPAVGGSHAKPPTKRTRPRASSSRT